MLNSLRGPLKIAFAAALLSTSAISIGTLTAVAQEKTVTVGGAPMYPSKNIVENAVNSKDHTTLVAAVKAAGLVDTLSGPGPFTVFAPTDAAFKKLPAGTVDTLVKPENKATLTKILTYHVVSGKMSAADLASKIKEGKGKAMLKTVEGEDLTAEESGGKVILVDAKGGKSTVTIADVNQSNGVIHVVDTVLMPK
ncbi:MAG: fasciclin domain-containing protein [Beijerinckiaceae bacterium]